MRFIKKPRFAFIGEYGGSVRCWWTKGLCRVDSDSDETVMSGNVVGRLCRAAHYSTWQKAFQFGTHRVSKRSLIIIMPTALLCCCCCCCAVLAMADIIVLKGRYPFYPQREKLLDGKLNGSARKKLRLRRDFNVIRECARIALILERRGNDKAHLPLVFHVIKHYG
ncbi:hypothetical protein ALC57_10070 [Trachymyrmex cornetzi]|uniref:Uncharacterized protein n=1 Tax=Trachymyrmex cornetzi TaxID=471704 RepID=A0A195DY01_9HYME|nr:hypothetical protein ALC57_10070 [Trachymyrmex cornetzi]